MEGEVTEQVRVRWAGMEDHPDPIDFVAPLASWHFNGWAVPRLTRADLERYAEWVERQTGNEYYERLEWDGDTLVWMGAPAYGPIEASGWQKPDADGRYAVEGWTWEVVVE